MFRVIKKEIQYKLHEYDKTAVKEFIDCTEKTNSEKGKKK